VLQQAGTPEDLYTKPTNVFVARFIGSPAMNLVPAGFIEGAGGGGRLAGFRPEHVVLGGRNGAAAHFHATVEVVEYLGDEQLVHLSARDEKLLAKLPVEDRVSAGEDRRFSIPRDKLHLFDAETELAVKA
jgi:ABC-type sugar transport system ATPase subunit